MVSEKLCDTIFVGDLLHAGTAGFDGRLQHPRIHTYLHTADEEAIKETYPCGVTDT